MISFIKKNILLFLILLSGFMFCQDAQLKLIDELLLKAENSSRHYNALDELKYAKKANILAKKINNSEKIAESYSKMAFALCILEIQNESFSYIKKAQEEPFSKKNIFMQAKLTDIKSDNYHNLGLMTQYIKENQNAINLIKDKTDLPSRILLQKIYLNRGGFYLENKPDSTLYYLGLSMKILKQIPEKKVNLELSELYAVKTLAFIKEEKDSSLYYIKKNIQLKEKYKMSVFFQQYIIFGDYYFDQKNYKEALNFYLKAIQNIESNSIRTPSIISMIYSMISETYGKLGDKKQQEKYAKIYSDSQKKILEEKNKNIDYALNVILKDKSDEYNNAQKKNYIYISIGILLLILFFFVLYKLLNKDLKHKENMISEVTNTLQNKEEIITQKDHETKQLQQKVNDSYQEVIDLAKNNDPAFYFRFQEVYPEFQKKLLETIPSLRTTELILCAYTFLGFSIKDIADYTFKSVNTVRNRKQNLRKKFNLQTEEDMGIWLRNLTGLNSQD